MNKVSRSNSYYLFEKQWAAVASAGVAGTVAAGPIGAAGAAIGMAAGCATANFFGHGDDSQSSSSGS